MRKIHKLSNKNFKDMTAQCCYCGLVEFLIINYRGDHMCKNKFDTEQFQEEQRKIKKETTSHLISNKNFTEGTCICSACGPIDMVKYNINPGQCGNRYREYNKSQIKNPNMVRHRLTDIDLDNRIAVCSVDGPVKIHGSVNHYQCAIKRRQTKKNQKKNRVKYYYYYEGGKISLWPEEREELMKSFGGACNICGIYASTRMHLDHDHKTGIFRGVLCDDHNLGLGRFHDSIEHMEAGIKYLQKAMSIVQALDATTDLG